MDLYNNMLPKGYKICKDVDDKKIMYFINNDGCTYFNDDSIAFIYTIEDDKELNILNLDVSSKYRGKGIGSFLMIVAAKMNLNKKILLDDMSDYSRNPNNIYNKLGLKYTVSKSTEPEMEGETNIVAEKMSAFMDKYLNNGFFS